MKIKEYAQMMGWLTRPPRQEPRFMAQGGRPGYKEGTSKKQLSFNFKTKKKPTTVSEATIDFIVEKGRQPKPSEALQIKEKLKKSVTNILTKDRFCTSFCSHGLCRRKIYSSNNK